MVIASRVPRYKWTLVSGQLSCREDISIKRHLLTIEVDVIMYMNEWMNDEWVNDTGCEIKALAVWHKVRYLPARMTFRSEREKIFCFFEYRCGASPRAHTWQTYSGNQLTTTPGRAWEFNTRLNINSGTRKKAWKTLDLKLRFKSGTGKLYHNVKIPLDTTVNTTIKRHYGNMTIQIPL